MAPPLRKLIGAAGCRYLPAIHPGATASRARLAGNVRMHTRLAICLRTCSDSPRSGEDRYILKDMPEVIFSSFTKDIRPRLRKSPWRRLRHDTILGQRIFVYKYMQEDFLALVRKQIPIEARKQVLKASLRGIAESHDHDIIHLGEIRHRGLIKRL